MEIKELKLSSTNCYLVGTGHTYVLIDGGYPSDWDLFSKRLEEVNIGLSDISHLVLTHHHDDHCGLLNRVVQANQDVRVVMSCRAPELLAHGTNDSTHRAGWVDRRARMIISLKRGLDKEFDRQWRTHAFPVYASRQSDILIQRKTRLDEIAIPLSGRILEARGHTSDSISVLLDDGSCFAGDAAANLPKIAGTKYCVILVEDIDEYYRTWGKLISAGARRIYPAHGEPFGVEELSRHMGAIKRNDIVIQA